MKLANLKPMFLRYNLSEALGNLQKGYFASGRPRGLCNQVDGQDWIRLVSPLHPGLLYMCIDSVSLKASAPY